MLHASCLQNTIRSLTPGAITESGPGLGSWSRSQRLAPLIDDGSYAVSLDCDGPSARPQDGLADSNYIATSRDLTDTSYFYSQYVPELCKLGT
jgi:hypothetical protein